MRKIPSWLALSGLGIFSLFVWISIPGLHPLRGPSLLDYVPRYLALFAPYAAAIYLLFRSPAPELPSTPAPPRATALAVLLFAVAFRLPLLTRPPTLSDDVYRYLWDGHVQNAGVSPYVHRVDSPALDPLETPSRDRVNNPDMASPYLPAAQWLFAGVVRLAPESPTAFQVLAAAFDVLAGLLLMLTLRRLGRPPEWALIYLWNPLAVVESAHGAHVDSLMVLLIMASLWSLPKHLVTGRFSDWAIAMSHSAFDPRSGHSTREAVIGNLSLVIGHLSFVFLALAALIKPIPLLLLPLLAPVWGWRRTLAFGGLVLAGLLAYAGAGLGLIGEVEAGTGLFGATRIYLARWNFNGGLYHWLEVGVTGYDTEGAVPAGMPGVALARAISLALLAALLAGLFVCALRRRPSVPQVLGRLYVPLAGYLLLATTVHPWYLAPLLAVLPLAAGPGDGRRAALTLAPWLYFSAALGLSYLTYLNPTDFRETDFVRQWEYFPLYGLLILQLAAAGPGRARGARDEPPSAPG